MTIDLTIMPTSRIKVLTTRLPKNSPGSNLFPLVWSNLRHGLKKVWRRSEMEKKFQTAQKKFEKMPNMFLKALP